MSGVGVVLGHQAASSQAFQVGILDGESLEVDDLVAVTTPDPVGDVVTFGVVTESHAVHEGATMPSDSMVIAQGQMPDQPTAEAYEAAVRELETSGSGQAYVVARANFEKLMNKVNQQIGEGMEKGAASSIITLS